MSEERFSGSKGMTPNRFQGYWTAGNLQLDTNPNDDLSDFDFRPQEDTPDHYIYELIRNGISIETIAKQLRLPAAEIERIARWHMDIHAQLNMVKKDLDEGVDALIKGTTIV